MRTSDLGRLERFYAGVLGLAVIRRDQARGSVWLEAGGVVVMLEHREDDEPCVPRETRELVAFDADDKEAWRERLASAGVALEAESAHTLYFRDPDGRRVAVSTYVFAEL